MLEFHRDGPILSVRFSGTLSEEDYEPFFAEVERSIETHGKVRMLLVMHDFHGWQPGALWEDLRFDARHFGDIERVAVVGEAKWHSGMTMLYEQFTHAEVRYFDAHQSQEAEEWIWENLPIPAYRATHHSAFSEGHDVVQEASKNRSPQAIPRPIDDGNHAE